MIDDEKQFWKVAKQGAVILFTGSWCKACPRAKQVLDACNVQYHEVEVDSPGLGSVVQMLGVQQLPTVVAMVDGETVDRVIGTPSTRQAVELARRI